MRWKSEERDRRERLPFIGRAQAERRLRPFCRRRLMTDRPARVLMRCRNPWVFLRLRVFG